MPKNGKGTLSVQFVNLKWLWELLLTASGFVSGVFDPVAWPLASHIHCALGSVLQSTWSWPSAAVHCTRICAGHARPHQWDWCGTDGAVNSQALKWCMSPFRKFFKKKLVQQEMLIMASVPISCMSQSIPCQLIMVLLTKCHLLCPTAHSKTDVFLFCPACTPEWTTLLLLSPGTCEHTGTTFSRHSYWVLKLFFFGEKKFFCNWGHKLLCTAAFWEYSPGLTFRH